jgi:alpha-L-fucosidase
LLSIPLRGDGTIDELEVQFLKGMADWMEINGEAIFCTRPWKIYGEGPTKIKSGMFNEGKTRFVPEDIRFTSKGDTLYAFIMGWPENTDIVIQSLSSASQEFKGKEISHISLLGYDGRIIWKQDTDGLKVQLPDELPCEHAVVLKINCQNR